jgi:Ig-like domain CHU_C associated
MRNTTRLLLTAYLCLGWLSLCAQQWSDVGDQGFTSTILTSNSTGPQYAARMAMYNNIPYMAFVNSNYDVDVMSYSGGNWSLLAPTGAGGNSTTSPISNVYLAIDGTGNLYIAYMISSVTYVKKYNGTAWSFVGSSSGIVQDNLNGIAINPVNQEPYIAVYDGGGTSKATVWRFNGTSWVTVGPGQFSSPTQALRLTISSTGVPHLTLQDGALGTTFSVQKFDGTNWVVVGATAIGNLGLNGRTDIAVDASGAPYVFSVNLSNASKASVLKFNGTAWVGLGQADFSAGAAGHPFFKFDNSGVLHVAYQDGGNANKATVMKFNGTAWVGVGDLGLSAAGVYTPSLAFNSVNLPFIGFRDAGTSGTKGTVMKLCTSNTSSITSTTPGGVCGVSGNVTLSATSTGTLRWYNSATNSAYVGTGATFVTPSITATTTYSVAAYDVNGCSSPRTAVVATVTALPTISNPVHAQRCGSGSLSLSATPSAGTVNWYNVVSGGSSLGTGTTFNTPSISTSSSFYAEAVNNGCVSTSRTQVLANINPIPQVQTAVNGSRCGAGTVLLSAIAESGTLVDSYKC